MRLRSFEIAAEAMKGLAASQMQPA